MADIMSEYSELKSETDFSNCYWTNPIMIVQIWIIKKPREDLVAVRVEPRGGRQSKGCGWVNAHINVDTERYHCTITIQILNFNHNKDRQDENFCWKAHERLWRGEGQAWRLESGKTEMEMTCGAWLKVENSRTHVKVKSLDWDRLLNTTSWTQYIVTPSQTRLGNLRYKTFIDRFCPMINWNAF